MEWRGRGASAVVALSLAIFASSIAVAQECDPDVCANPWATKLRSFAALKPAKVYCGAGRVVWGRAKSRAYHTTASPKFGRAKPGAYACEASVRRLGGYRAGSR